MDVPFFARVVVVLILYIGLLAVLFSRVRTPKRTQTDALTVRTQGAETAVTVESVQNLVLKTVRGIPDVADVQADVKSFDGKADITLNVVTENDTVNVPAKQREINRALDQVINKQLGLQMSGRPKVNVQLGGVKPAPAAYVEPAVITPAPVKTEVTPPPAPVVSVTPPSEPVKEEPKGGFFDRFGFSGEEVKSELPDSSTSESSLFSAVDEPDDKNRDL